MQHSARRQALGRGLSALLEPNYLGKDNELEANSKQSQVSLPLDRLKSGRYQPRKIFNDDDIKELSVSIKEVGILQPILVRSVENDMFEIIAGERRWRAAKSLGLSEIPVIIKNFSDFKVFEASLIENVQRQDLSPIEEADGYKQFMTHFGYTQDQLSDKFGKSRSHIANSLRLLSLPDKVKAYIAEGKLSTGHAKAILGSEKPNELAETIIRDKLNVRQSERLAKKALTGKSKEASTSDKRDDDLVNIEQGISQIFKTKVKISLNGQRGDIILSFDSLQKFDEIIAEIIQ